MPKSFIESYDNIAPHGDEMGLIAYLPFEDRKENTSGIIEIVFTPNNRSIFKDSEGNVVKKNQPLILKPADVANMADKNNDAPVRERSQLTKLNFDWAFNHDELLINLNMLDREINKQSIYVTVRNVEDLNGNRMVSPVMWQAFVDRNSLKWQERTLKIHAMYGDQTPITSEIDILNQSGIRHQYVIEEGAEWMSVDLANGSINPDENKTVRITCSTELPVGVYSELLYLTDENGLSEPLRVELTIESENPWENDTIDVDTLNLTMSMRGQVYIEDENGNGYYDSDERDIVAVFCNGMLVSQSNNTYSSTTGYSYVYLTIHGNEKMNGALLTFKLWRASTGKIYNLTPSEPQRFAVNGMRGISPKEPIRLTTSAGTALQIKMHSGWNWISWCLLPTDASPNALLTTEQGFSDNDLIKSAVSQAFAQLKDDDNETDWKGSLLQTDYHYMYMVRVAQPLTLNIDGRTLNDQQRTLTLNQGWNSVAYLLDEPVNMREALTDYKDHASEGDLIKSKTQFAVFTKNGKWEGSLQTMYPGQGYLLRRLAKGEVKMHYYNPKADNKAPKKVKGVTDEQAYSNPNAASNMTLIAQAEGAEVSGEQLAVYVDNQLAGVATPITIGTDVYYFITVQSELPGELRFEMGGETLMPSDGAIYYSANQHAGSLNAPVMLKPTDNRPYKMIEDNHVVIIRGGDKYDITGKKLNK